MKELGETFKEKREEIGITINEVANDLGIQPIIIENLEDGNAKVFKDVLELKDVVFSLAKYLGIDEKYVSDELNDYMFSRTSKISIEDIKEQLEKTKEKEVKKISSPYTKSTDDKKKSNTFVIIAIISLSVLLIVIFYFVLKKIYIG